MFKKWSLSMLVIGLTGGIGSGKSTVADLFADLGVPIIDADAKAREVTQPDKPAFLNIVKHFGDDILLSNGTLDRAKLRNIIFSDSKERLWLENLLHPLIREEMQHEINHLTGPYCIAVIPLLLEVEFYSFINRILVVDASLDAQIVRVMTRDKMNKLAVEAILKTQATRVDRKARAQDIIINDGTLADLIPQVEKLHEKYSKMESPV
jgi:dephospho-CoA kinase